MYNRYAPQEGFQPLEPAPEEHPGGGSPLSFLQRLLGNEKNAGGGGILDLLGLGKLDTGDILLLLVLIYLFRESEDEEWLIILALVLLMGLG
jgi:hypothetical protein